MYTEVLKMNEEYSSEGEISSDDLVRLLQEFGFTENDSKIYITLLQLQIASPSEISKISNVERSRVYDSLKRLSKRGFVLEESVKRPRFRPIDPERMISIIRANLQRKMQTADALEQSLRMLSQSNVEKMGVWTLTDKKTIKSNFKELIEGATSFCFIIYPELFNLNEMLNLADMLIEKKKANPNIEIIIAMHLKQEFKKIYHEMFKMNIQLKHFGTNEMFPFGLAVAENILFTVLTDTKSKPEYSFGIIFEKPEVNIINSFRVLATWFFSTLCKKVVFEKKTDNLQIGNKMLNELMEEEK